MERTSPPGPLPTVQAFGRFTICEGMVNDIPLCWAAESSGSSGDLWSRRYLTVDRALRLVRVAWWTAVPQAEAIGELLTSFGGDRDAGVAVVGSDRSVRWPVEERRTLEPGSALRWRLRGLVIPSPGALFVFTFDFVPWGSR